MEILKDKKFLNGWSVVGKNSEFGNPGDVVLIYQEAGKKKKISIPFGDKWYFYVKKNPKASSTLEGLKSTYKIRTVEGKDWIRVYTPKILYKDPSILSLVNDLEMEGIETYEADVSPMKRFCLDNDIQIEDWGNVKVLYFDIETDDSEGKIEIGKYPILSFAGVDQNGKEYFISSKNEKELLLEAKKLLRQFDMLVGWNSKDFDIPYLKERFKIHKIWDEYLGNILHEDMMQRVIYFYSKDPESRQSISSYSLDYISKYFIKEGKIDRGGKVIDLFNQDPTKFKEYNLQDCHLLRKLEQKLGTIRLTYMMFQWCQVFAQNWSMVKTIDNFILSEANKKGVHYRTNLAQLSREEDDKPSEVFLGAYVLDPEPGYYENVYDLDFKSLYPNIIRTFNVSPETHLKRTDLPIEVAIHSPSVHTEKNTDHGGQFFRKETGIIPGKISRLLEQREEIRKEMKNFEKDSQEWRDLNVKQLIVKELANSIYGVLGNKWFRSFSIPLAESITATGQYLIKYVKKINEEQGRKVIYGDTDSVFMTIKEGEKIETVLDWINKSIEAHLKKEFGVVDNTIQMALDIKFDQYIIETKKKYVGKTGEKYKFVGMECIKRDTIPVVINYQKKLIDRIMNRDSLESLKEWIAEKKQIVEKDEFKVEDITIRKKLGKKADSYKTDSIHIRIVKELAKKKTFSLEKSTILEKGYIVPYIITDGSKKLEGVHISEFKGQWDRTYYWNSVIFPPLERMLTSIYPNEKWDEYYLTKEPKLKKIKEPNKKKQLSLF